MLTSKYYLPGPYMSLAAKFFENDSVAYLNRAPYCRNINML